MIYLYIIYFKFLLLTLFCIFAFIIVKNNYNSKLTPCISETTKLQNTHKKLTLKLLGLNNYALSLRIQRKSAEAAYASAPEPYSKSAAKAYLETIKLLQKALVLKQKSILSLATLYATKSYSSLFAKGYLLIDGGYTLEVESYPKNSDSPSYRLKKNYKSRKTIKFKTYFNILNGLPHLLKKNFNLFNGFTTLTCGALITQKGDKPSDIKLILDNF